MKNIISDYVNFKLGVTALLVTLLSSIILVSIANQAAAVAQSSGTGMERTWVIDLIIMKFEGFKWSGLN